MKLSRSSLVKAVCISVALTGAVSISAMMLSADVAFAKNDKNNGNGNGNGNGHNKSANVGNGHGNSALGALNAAHASANALLHANPNSRVGRIAVFRDAVLETGEMEADRDAAQALLDLMAVPDRTSGEVNIAIAEAVLAGATAEELAILDAELAAALAYEGAAGDVAELEAALAERPAIERTLLEAAANKVVTDEVEEAVEDLLGLN